MNTITNDDGKCAVALAALQNVVDPEINLNVVDLGLIYRIDFEEGALSITCTMTLTTQFCPMGESITEGVKDALQYTFSEYNVNVILTFTPAWNHEMISDEGRMFLNN